MQTGKIAANRQAEMTEPELPLACNLSAIEASQRDEHLSGAARLLFDVAGERQELSNGYAFRFEAEHYREIVDFIANERLCCPFFHFSLDIAPGHGPIWLHITGNGDVKTFLRAELNKE